MHKKARILTYHRIGHPRDGKSYEALTVSPQRFKAQLRAMHFLGCTFEGPDAMTAWLRDGDTLPFRYTVLTFDDGFEDLYVHAFPLLQKEGIPAIIYLVSDCTEDKWQRQRSPAPLRLLNWAQIREMADSGIIFGSHTRTHVRLTLCTGEQLHDEVANSKKVIEDKLGRAVTHFCYPFGKLNDRVVDEVGKAGYTTACTTKKGSVLHDADLLQLPRLKVGKRMGWGRFLLRMTLRS